MTRLDFYTAGAERGLLSLKTTKFSYIWYPKKSWLPIENGAALIFLSFQALLVENLQNFFYKWETVSNENRTQMGMPIIVNSVRVRWLVDSSLAQRLR